jgi:hypothetical protein
MDMLHTLPADTFVTAALAELLDDVTNLLASAQAQKPCDKDEIGFWRRQLSALNKAESYWLQGVRPQLGGATYLLASASRPGALVHRLTKQGGIVVCSCEAGQRSLLCWHHMLCNVVERAAELETLAAQKEAEISGGSEPTPDVASAPIPHREEAAAWLALQTRLAVTARYVATLRAGQRTAEPQHIRVQARAAYAQAARPASRRPLFAERDAETYRRYALSEERAELLELRARRAQARSDDPPFEDNPLGDDEGDTPPARRLGLRLVQARRKSAYFASAFYLAA